jgi:serine/threonine protein kinase
MEVSLNSFRNSYIYDESEKSKDFLGEGGFSKTYLAYHNIRQRKVVLKFFKEELNDHDLRTEVTNAINLQHPNLIQYYDFYELIDGDQRRQVAVLEYANGGDLKKFVSNPPNSRTFTNYLKDIIDGLAYLERAHIIHRDIKLENILISYDSQRKRSVAKIADFGLAKVTKDTGNEDDKEETISGTPTYLAPELISDSFAIIDPQTKAPTISYNVDIWCLGIMIYYIYKGMPPSGFYSNDQSLTAFTNTIIQQELDSVDLKGIPIPFRYLVEVCLVKNARERIQSALDLKPYLEGKKKPPKKIVIPPQIRKSIKFPSQKSVIISKRKK